MILLCWENSENATQKAIRINKFSRVKGYKINIQKFDPFLYTNNKLSKTETKKKPFIIASKRIRYVGVTRIYT